MPARKKETLPQKKAKKIATKKAVPKKKPIKSKSSPKAPSGESAKDSAGILKENSRFPIVGIGSSAGGLEALELFFSNLPHETNMAFVIIQHLSPKHKSIMADILMKYTAMKVLQIKDNQEIKPNYVYLNPPDKNVITLNSRLHLAAPTQTHGVNLPIDCFFRSLSEDQGEKAICIILSGTATDGTLGLKAIKGEGGMAMVQDPESAKYAGMPSSAIATGLVDFILPVEKIPEALIRYVQHPYIERPEIIETAKQQFRSYVQKILALIRTRTGHDFSNYKQTTIRRRIERRMAVHQIDTIKKYDTYLNRTPAEIDTLFKDLLIGVTNFFRDAEAFGVLKAKVIPELIKNKNPKIPLRIWVAGCATGEEAYSIAILFAEVMDKLKKQVNIQIFASDIDNEALDFARMAVYSDSVAADVSQERLDRFFIKEDNTYRIKKQIRDMVVFADQNVIKDPPFSRLDLVSCRNLLIYMEPVLQKKILPLFHYTLTHQGILFLGTSESIGEFSHLFSPISSKWKIFKYNEYVIDRMTDYPRTPLYDVLPTPQGFEEKRVPTVADIHNLAERIILDNYAPPCVLINEQYEILHFIGQTDRYLAPPIGKASFNVLKMAREGLKYKLSTALHKAVKQKKTIISEGLKIKHNNIFRTVDLVVRPLTESGFTQGFILVMFEDKTLLEPVARKRTAKKNEMDPYVLSLEQELQSTKEYLQTTNEELETSNEELKSTNEELQSVNEELQSTNEELETSKEELQSTNEELVTVNAELQKKVEELSETNNDINNLLASTEIATIFLDINLCIKRFTPAITKLFNLIQTDIGRPIGDITANIKIDDLYGHAREVLNTLVRQEVEVQDKKGNWYSMRIAPYRTLENVIDGVVLTFVDISQLKQIKDLNRLATVVRDSNDAVTVQDLDYNIVAWNNGAQQMYGWSEAEALKMDIRQLVPKGKIKEMEAFIKMLKNGESVNSLETQRTCKNGKILNVWLTITALKDGSGRPIEIATTERDISELKQLRETSVKS
ncbi:MAG: chemotaxis protein CheB [Desulfobacterales bacterium]